MRYLVKLKTTTITYTTGFVDGVHNLQDAHEMACDKYNSRVDEVEYYKQVEVDDVLENATSMDEGRRCSECGDLVEYCGELNNLDQCSECSMICELCGVSVNRETVVNGICLKCK